LPATGATRRTERHSSRQQRNAHRIKIDRITPMGKDDPARMTAGLSMI